MNLSKELEVWDFSHKIDSKMTTFPAAWHRKTQIEILGTIESVGRRSSHVSIGTHAGTHVDAPSHFIKNGKSIDQLDLKAFFGVGFCLKVNLNHIQSLSIEKQLLAQLKFAPRNQALFFNFGWGRFYLDAEKYYKEQPWISVECAQEILNLNPPILGYDLAMLDNPSHGYGCTIDSPIHKLFLGSNIPLIENAVFPNELSGEILYAAIPLSLNNLDGSPVRFIGWR